MKFFYEKPTTDLPNVGALKLFAIKIRNILYHRFLNYNKINKLNSINQQELHLKRVNSKRLVKSHARERLARSYQNIQRAKCFERNQTLN